MTRPESRVVRLKFSCFGVSKLFPNCLVFGRVSVRRCSYNSETVTGIFLVEDDRVLKLFQCNYTASFQDI